MISARIVRIGLGATLVALVASLPAPASAQGLFEMLFGGVRRAAPPPTVSAYVDPSAMFDGGRRRDYEGGGPSLAYCVRTCDGRFFPVQRSNGMTHAELCKSFCPAARTMVFNGSKIDHAVSSNGVRYAELDNAFVYRERVVDNCTCNGKEPFGLAQLSVSADPTLRPGDIVATNDGLATYRGGRAGKAEFAPIAPSASEWGRRLAQTKVEPRAEPPKITPVADEPAPRKARKRAVYYSR